MARLECYCNHIQQQSSMNNVTRACGMAIQATQSMLKSFPNDPFAAQKMAWFQYKTGNTNACDFCFNLPPFSIFRQCRL